LRQAAGLLKKQSASIQACLVTVISEVYSLSKGRMSNLPEFDQLKSPISADQPCGENLEDTQLLSAFDAYRLFGQSIPLNPSPDWREIKAKSLEALKVSKDFRLLAHLAACELRLAGLGAFCQVLEIAADWIEQYWQQVYPQLDDDAVFRRNALNSFADRMAIVDGVRRWPLVSNRQLGSISLRDVEIATGQTQASEADTAPPDASRVDAVFAAAAADELSELQKNVQTAIAALKAIESRMRDAGGSEAAPSFDPLLSPLLQIQRIVADHAPGGDNQPTSEVGGDVNESSGVATVAVGAIKSRQDAIKALDAVAGYFRQNEPSSPVPMFLERAKRLVAKDFLAVLADIAPDALGQAKIAGGIKDE
jgi:type VI secretion system protein ImpA